MKTDDKTAPGSPAGRAGDTLDARYGKIGISAVAAAMRYQGEARNPDSPPSARADAAPAGSPPRRRSILAA